jgi:chloramphenicol-sensitive protein RarD
LYAIGAYGTWGMFPVFFPLLQPATAPEVLAHRIVWTALFMAVVLISVGRVSDLRSISGRTWLLLACASILISINWIIYVYAVNNGHVVDAALGYFINPLVSVLFGMMIFGERLNRAQSAAVLIALAAIIVLSVEADATPMIGLGLAMSFGLYGVVKKVV